MTRIVFHLGDRKTGSTAIQSTLSSGAWKYDGVSLLFPMEKGVSHASLSKSISAPGQPVDIANRPEAAPLWCNCRQDQSSRR